MTDRATQIRTVHAGFINGVVEVCCGRRPRAELDGVLAAAERNGWEDVVSATRRIVSGQRDQSLLNGLDEEDSVIVGAILEGLQNPASLPDPAGQPEGHEAAPGLASIIDAAARGDTDAMRALGTMGEQMSEAGGDLALVAATLRRLVNGERDVDRLAGNMGPRARALLQAVVDELSRRDLQ